MGIQGNDLLRGIFDLDLEFLSPKAFLGEDILFNCCESERTRRFYRIL